MSMDILAIIPARAGSKGIPNKNIRIINGYPLIHYAINNAKKSKYITDIIVSTDSPEVQMIAKQMNVSYINRSKELCGDFVTLDSVIYDAIPKDKKYDYIITMQPTSPTLNVETLDNAINYMIDNNLDTLISAVDKPHLFWTKNDNQFLPNYNERLNRQYLPSHYEETGAFVISKSNIVTENTRIGKKIEVYEISEDEAIDIDTFNDLRIAESILNKKTIAMYCNGNNIRGMGHVYRVLEIADSLYVKPDIYYDINQTDVKIFGNTTHNLIPINGEIELFNKCKEKDYDIFINDILATDVSYMESLRRNLSNAKIINFEDDGEGAKKADLVIDALFENNDEKNHKYGKDYYIAPKTFLLYDKINIKEKVKSIFICFGGADPCNYTDRILNIIKQEKYKNYNFIIAIGKAKKNINELLNKNTENIEILYDVKNMPELMSKCDIAITSRGRTAFELAILGIPTIAMSQNENEEKHEFISNENGFSYIGLNPTDEVIEKTLDLYISLSKNSRQKYQDLLLSHNLKNGRNRVLNLINSIR